MAENKTKQTKASVSGFLQGLKDPQQKRDAKQLVSLMKTVTLLPPKMWGPAMVGFGDLHYRYASGREGDIFALGFAARKGSLVIYGMGGTAKRNKKLMVKLGPHKLGGSCLYISSLDDTHLPTLKKLLQLAFKAAKSK